MFKKIVIVSSLTSKKEKQGITILNKHLFVNHSGFFEKLIPDPSCFKSECRTDDCTVNELQFVILGERVRVMTFDVKTAVEFLLTFLC